MLISSSSGEQHQLGAMGAHYLARDCVTRGSMYRVLAAGIVLRHFVGLISTSVRHKFSANAVELERSNLFDCAVGQSLLGWLFSNGRALDAT
uniref:Uncharacterized protein n=1 Tax=Globisporangium ultimum (strain ATCC 200006 / CBS 805.95 / DAOM BR144) TaxID=431595 RepID=K3X7D1_GLOUD